MTSTANTIYVLNGPNLNLLGTREPEIYGSATLADVEALCQSTAEVFGMAASCHQSNREGELIDLIHQAGTKKAAGIVINAGGYSHTSIAIHDALIGVKLPAVEVHVSNVHAREPFRRHSYFSDIAAGCIVGLGPKGYELALDAALDHIERTRGAAPKGG